MLEMKPTVSGLPGKPRTRKQLTTLAFVSLIGCLGCGSVTSTALDAAKPVCSATAGTPNAPSAVAVPAPPKAPRCGLPSNIPEPEWPTTLSSTVGIERTPMPQDAATVVLIPDTQYYASCRYRHLLAQSTWIAQERTLRHILGAISLGDLTDHNTDDEWSFVKESFAPIGKGFPLMLTNGNHDTGSHGTCDSRDTLLSKYFDQDFAASSGALRAVKTPGNIENAFYSLRFDTPGKGSVKLGVLMLEWSPRKSTVDWANQVLTQHKDHRVIVATHAYLYNDGTRYDYATRERDQLWSPLEYLTARDKLGEDQNHDGEMLWNALIRRHPGIFLVVSGHVLGQGTGRLTSRGDAGNMVHQILVNYQMLDEGGLGYLRFFELYPDGRSLHMKTYSPSLGLYAYASDQDFRLEIEPPLFTVPQNAARALPQKMAHAGHTNP